MGKTQTPLTARARTLGEARWTLRRHLPPPGPSWPWGRGDGPLTESQQGFPMATRPGTRLDRPEGPLAPRPPRMPHPPRPALSSQQRGGCQLVHSRKVCARPSCTLPSGCLAPVCLLSCSLRPCPSGCVPWVLTYLGSCSWEGCWFHNNNPLH